MIMEAAVQDAMALCGAVSTQWTEPHCITATQLHVNYVHGLCLPANTRYGHTGSIIKAAN